MSRRIVQPKPPAADRCPFHPDKRAETRGVCQSCYTSARKLVNAGEASWHKLEQLGLIKPAHSQPRNPLVVAYQMAVAQEQAAKAVNGKAKKTR